MTINSDLILLPSIMFGIFSLYSIMKQTKKIEVLEKDIEIILKTHNGYMEVQELTHEAVKDLYDMMEGVASSIPFTSKHDWQNRMLQRKLQRELDRHIDEDEHVKYKEEEMVKQIQENQKRERDEMNRKRKVEVQISRVLGGCLTPQTKFWDDMGEEDWCDNK
jgi:hypothetical protein